MASYNIGIDLGGTNVRVGVVDEHGHIIEEVSDLTEAKKGPKYVVDKITKMINSLENKDKISSIGIGAPGPLNPNTGVIIEPPNLLGWKNVPIVEMIYENTGIYCRLDNDANVAGLAEAKYGNGKDFDIVQYITISTGIGGGLIINKKIVSGSQGAAGEIGQMRIIANSPKQLTSSTLEDLSSGTAIAKFAKERKITNKGAKEVFELADNGNIDAKRLINEVLDYLAVGIANITHTVNPDIFILGGGVTESLKKYGYINELIAKVRGYVYNSLVDFVNIKPAKLGTKAGIIGAANLVKF
ncbi:hypothetical protein BHF71_09825 [Vulcanibacillus modesticaldus]|uniref:Glucose kinase n=1 Tax=Vulcanibacillus modesticaldus TaxID=337097 RepID=A0A1D2YU43_9BACI|nr:ROK family protein [Vulcanibacillus modesticaldus]OEF99171.1 hypothetical protein BHF71_09825 [Vulcanibacillus modesticaldus]